jgi:hypothetical protein
MVDLADPRVFETAIDSLEVGVYLVDQHRKIGIGTVGQSEFLDTCDKM